MTTTRQLILDHLRRRSPASAGELARALNLTGANIRRHLTLMEQEGAIAQYAQRPAEGRGRPARLFVLAGKAHSHNLDGLSSALLEVTLNDLPASDQDSSLKALALRMAGATKLHSLSSSLTRRLNEGVNRLNEMHYEARWEARPGAPHLILGHCPYAAILSDHPELCRLDAHLLETLLHNPVTQTERLSRDPSGRTFCRFVLRGS